MLREYRSHLKGIMVAGVAECDVVVSSGDWVEGECEGEGERVNRGNKE
jgi:hypothetical protein